MAPTFQELVKPMPDSHLLETRKIARANTLTHTHIRTFDTLTRQFDIMTCRLVYFCYFSFMIIFLICWLVGWLVGWLVCLWMK